MAKTTKQNTAPQTQDQARPRQDVATLQPARLPFHPVYQERYGVDGVMWRALVEAVYPSAKTVEGIILAVSYCRAKGYDVMKKMVHVVPIWNSQLKKEVEGVWESVAALRTTAFRTGEYMGCDATVFGPMKTFHFDDTVGWGEKAERVQMDVDMPEWAQVTVYRLIAGQRCAFPGPRVYYIGAYGAKGKSEIPNEKWGTSGDSYMLEKCAEAAALRKAFPEELGSINAAEEMEGRKVDIAPGPTINHEPTPPRPTQADARKAEESARQQSYEMDKQYRQTMGDSGGETDEQSDPQTGEIIEPESAGDAPADNGSNAGEQQPDAEHAPAAAGIDHSALANKIIADIKKAGMLGSLTSLTNRTYVKEIAKIAAEDPDMHAKIQAAIDERKKWFAR